MQLVLARRLISLVTTVALVLAAETARAEQPAPPSRPEPLTWSYLYDGGAIPFLWGAGALYVVLKTWVEPRKSPLFFSANEGGKEPLGDSITDSVLAVNGGISALIVAAAGDDSRWFHTKGFLEAWVTTAAITRVTKLTFGRHRPDYDLTGENPPSERSSFFSGHSSATFAHATYLGLYLRYHVFDKARGDRLLPWWEATSYLVLGAAAAYVPYSRVADHRHYVSDVVVGSVVGAATAAAFFYWQERRYQRAVSPRPLASRDAPRKVLLLPDLEHPGLSLTLQW